MSVLITALVLVLLGLWATAAYGRLLRLRRAVRSRWRDVAAARKRRQDHANEVTAPAGSPTSVTGAEHALEKARLHYNLVATKYNTALARLPYNVVASLAGFKPAELLSPEEAAGTTTGASS
jgi:hypothetical protein